MASGNLKCGGCLKPIPNRLYLTCSLCAQVYDLDCANVSEKRFYNTMTVDHKKVWECVVCKSQKPKTCNTNTPIRQMYCDANVAEDSFVLEPHLDRDRETLSGLYVNNSTRRKPNPNITVENSYAEDTVFLDSIRTVVREELQQIIDERLSNLISKVITEKVALAFSSEITNIKNRIMALETAAINVASELALEQPPAMQSPVTVTGKTIKANSTCNTDKPKHTKPKTRLNNELKKNDLGSTLSTDFQQPQPPPRSLASSSTAELQHNSHDGLKDTPGCEEVDGDDEWTEVKRKRRIPTRVTRGTAAPGKMQLEACERRRYLHLYYVKIGTTTEQVCAHLTALCGGDVCTAETLRARGQYASFKLSVPSRLADNVLAPENWPEDVCVKPWRQSFRVTHKQKQQI